MKTRILFTMFIIGCFFEISAQTQQLKHLASYQTNMEDAAETVAYDALNKRAIFTSSAENTLTIIDIKDPENPTFYKKIDLCPYGAGPNSVALYKSIIAVAVEANPKQDAGKVIFFDVEGNFLKEVATGALPDMLLFTPDGTKLIVANEGEPSDDYRNDPEGSISIIDISAGISTAKVTTIGFESYNAKKSALINKGIRIFGNNGTATVAEDLEPEFIAVSQDGTKAFITCQENNAIVSIDLTKNEILDIVPLGFKNHSTGTPLIDQYALNEMIKEWPVLGQPVYDGGQEEILLGGFSGLFFDKINSTDTELIFYTVPDRGPNGDAVSNSGSKNKEDQKLRPFKLPEYQGRIVKFTFNKVSGTISLDDQILLHRKDGTTPITGKGNIPGFDEVPVTYTDKMTPYDKTDYIDADQKAYHALSYDAYGGDFEGIVRDKNGFFWMCDEYRPSIYKFKEDGTLIERYVPQGTSQLGDVIKEAGTYGKETLPEVYAKRRPNRGFEAIAYDENADIIYAFIQSPLYNPSNDTKNNSDVIRILGVNAADGMPVSEYIYLLERNKDDGYATSRVDKIGDAVFKENGKFLVIERDSEDSAVLEGKKYIFEIDINQATNILDFKLPVDKELEEMTADEINTAGIRTVHKTKITNLPSIGYQSSDKPEGLAWLPNNEIAVINDNDFGIAGAGTTNKSGLGIISFANDHGFDSSDVDGKINSSAHPTLGMFMPDGIASYEVKGVNYIVTANEGDARDYDGYSEEVRVKDLKLNPLYYPNASVLQKEENLGRLKTTLATGDYDGDGIFEQIYSYGARSFSIFDEYGNLVFDSANMLEQTIIEEEPNLFNEDKGEFDKRSDDKGVEPEAVALGKIGDRTYAFIGLERQSGISMYDITDPRNVAFITYYKGHRDTGDVAPEIIKFVNASESPNGNNLLLVGYEVSGTVGIIQIDEEVLTISEQIINSSFTMFPNPVVGNTELKFNKKLSGDIYDLQGKFIGSFNNSKIINTSGYTEGVYIIKTKENGTKRFLKL